MRLKQINDPLSSMTPTIGSKRGFTIYSNWITRGSTIITNVMQSILNIIEYDMDVKKAASAPRFHSQWLPDVIQVEPHGIIKDVLKNLKSVAIKFLITEGVYWYE